MRAFDRACAHQERPFRRRVGQVRPFTPAVWRCDVCPGGHGDGRGGHSAARLAAPGGRDEPPPPRGVPHVARAGVGEIRAPVL